MAIAPLLLAAPRPALAQESRCGSHVSTDHRTELQKALGFDYLGDPSDIEASPQPLAPPCHGPNCSRAPERRPLAPTVPPPSVERWMTLDVTPPPDPDAPYPLPFFPSPRPSIDPGDGPLRPPR